MTSQDKMRIPRYYTPQSQTHRRIMIICSQPTQTPNMLPTLTLLLSPSPSFTLDLNNLIFIFFLNRSGSSAFMSPFRPPMSRRTDVTRAIIWHQFTPRVIEVFVCSALPVPIIAHAVHRAEVEGGGTKASIRQDGATAADISLGEAGAAVEEGTANGLGFEVERFECVYLHHQLWIKARETWKLWGCTFKRLHPKIDLPLHLS